jgi:[ribosomal protein S18]-alanine N-acetyltransferase
MKTRLITDPADAPQLAAIHAQCFTEVWNDGSIAALLATPGAFAIAENDALGFILVRVAGDESEVLTLGVTPAARRRGVASMLVLDASGHAARMGAAIMFLEVNCSNFPAIALYKRLGFSEVGRRKAYYIEADGQRRDALVLRVEIPLLRVCNRLQLG